MAASIVPVIYSAATGAVRRWTLFDERNETDNHARAVRPGKGEAVILIDLAQYGDLATLQSLVTKASGLDPSRQGHAEVDPQGNVVAVLNCDPACGDLPLDLRNTLVPCDARAVRVGFKAAGNGKVFIAPPEREAPVGATPILLPNGTFG